MQLLNLNFDRQINKNYEQISKENKKKTQWKEKISERTLNIEQVVSKEKETAGIMVLSVSYLLNFITHGTELYAYISTSLKLNLY